MQQTQARIKGGNKMYKIEKGLPMPEPRGKQSEIGKALQLLAIGDSFTFPASQRSSVQQSISQFMRRNKSFKGKKFVTRTILPEKKLVRVWRIK